MSPDIYIWFAIDTTSLTTLRKLWRMWAALVNCTKVRNSRLLVWLVHYLVCADDTTNKKMTESSNNKISCIFEDISLRPWLIRPFLFDLINTTRYQNMWLFLDILYIIQNSIANSRSPLTFFNFKHLLLINSIIFSVLYIFFASYSSIDRYYAYISLDNLPCSIPLIFIHIV